MTGSRAFGLPLPASPGTWRTRPHPNRSTPTAATQR